MPTLGRLLLHLRGALIVTPWLLALLVQDLLLSLLLLLRPFSPALAYRLSVPIVWSCWASIQLIFERLNGARVAVSRDSDPLPRGESAVVVCNHVGWCDFYLVQALAIRAGMLGHARYFAKAQLRRVPLLGWGLYAAGMPMVIRNWQHDKRELDKVFEGIVKYKFKTWLISFSEATRFTPAKHAQSQEWCAANGRPQPQHLLYPRTRGFVATVQHVRRAPHVKAVYDLTVAYRHGARFQEAPRFWDTLSVPGLSDGGGGGGGPAAVGGANIRGAAGRREAFRFEVRARRFPMEEMPAEDAELARWIEARWVEKGEWLERKRVEWEEEDARNGKA